jgi:nitroreductase
MSLQPSLEQVLCLLRGRRSIRAFQDMPVERTLIEQVIDGANTGPTPHNAHRIEYVVVQDRATIKRILDMVAESNGKLIYLLHDHAAFDSLPVPVKEKLNAARPLLPSMERIVNRIKTDDDILQRGAPALLVLHAPRIENDLFDASIDANIAIQNASLICSSLGLGSCELGYLEAVQKNDPRIRKALYIPNDHAIFGALAIGYPKYKFESWIEKPMAKIEWN